MTLLLLQVKMMKILLSYWRKALAWLEDHSDKERLLVLIGVLLVILIVWFLLLYAPIKRSINMKKALIEASNQQFKVFKDRADLIVAEAKNSPAKLLKEKHEKLSKDLTELSSHLVVYDAQTLEPGEVIPVLRKLLVNNRVQLTHLERTSVEPLSESMIDGSKLWQANFVMEFAGNYFSTLHYLEALEEIKYRIFWEGLEYKVTDYPQGTVKLSIYTLNESDDEEAATN